MRIVVVEDEVRIREGIIKLLGKMGEKYEVVAEAWDGKCGLEICLKEKPDLIITDIRMPEMDGLAMLSAIKEAKVQLNAIVLSAFSEFEYAKKAISLGVTEYLLKPISVTEFKGALEHIENKIIENKKKKPDRVGTLEQLIAEALNRDVEVDDETAHYLEEHYEFRPRQEFFVVCEYIGSNYDKEIAHQKKKLEKTFSFYKGISFRVVESRYYKSLIALIYNYTDSHDIERWIQYQILQREDVTEVFGCVTCENLSKMRTAINELYQYMDWNISFEKKILISYPKITQVHTEICSYPVEAEQKCKVALCENDVEKFYQNIKKMQESFLDGKVYHPKEIKDCYVRFIWKMLEIAKDVSFVSFHDVDYQDLLGKVMNAKSGKELNEICDSVFSTLFEKKNTQIEVSDLTVLRTKSLIHEFYNTGITLEEIAIKLQLTPEYLGTKFHKETGMSFKNYMKNVRMNKAKELLVGTNLKLYEISEQVGYSDSKYFSKVFKEVTGQLPADYRKTLK